MFYQFQLWRSGFRQGANPDEQRFRNRLEKGEIDSADKKTDVFKPALSGGIGLKLHASVNLDNNAPISVSTGIGFYNHSENERATWAASGYRYFTDFFGIRTIIGELNDYVF